MEVGSRVGQGVGGFVGLLEGIGVGGNVGDGVGGFVGTPVGGGVGKFVGDGVGGTVGLSVGTRVANWNRTVGPSLGDDASLGDDEGGGTVGDSDGGLSSV